MLGLIDLEQHTGRDIKPYEHWKTYSPPTHLIIYSAQGNPGLTKCEDLATALPTHQDITHF